MLRLGVVLRRSHRWIWQGQVQNGQGSLQHSPGLPLSLTDHHTAVWHNNKMQTVRDVVLERRKTEPNCKVAYHEMHEADDSAPGSFTLEQKYQVYFIPDPTTPVEKEQPVQMSAGMLVPKEAWASSSSCDIVWGTKWAINGLTPVRPLVVMKVDAKILPGRVLVIA